MEIITGTINEPRKVTIYGGPGIGKTTFAASAPSPFFIPCEDGCNNVNVARPKTPPRSFAEVEKCLQWLFESEHDFRTVAVDSLDALEQFIFAEVCKEHRIKSIGDIDYGRGYMYAMAYWRRFTAGLDFLRSKRGMQVVLVCHAMAERFEDPETSGYDRYTLKLNKQATAHIVEWSDEVLFATREIHTREAEGKFKKSVSKAIGGRRVLRTEARPAAIAKNRLGLPPELELNWSAFSQFLPSL